MSWFSSIRELKRRMEVLSKRLIECELELAMQEAQTPTEVQANCKEIEHKIDVGYYQGK